MSTAVDEVQMLAAGPRRGGAPHRILGNEIWVRVGSQETGGRFAVCEIKAPPMGGPPLHVHSRENEWFYVLEGRFLFELDGREEVVRPGMSLSAPRGIPHTFMNLSERPSRLLVMADPGGLDQLFAEAAAALRGQSKPDPAALDAILRRYGIETLGPPIAGR